MERQDCKTQPIKEYKTIAIDFDGVLTDGKHYLTELGTRFYATHSRDNWAIARLIDMGFVVDIVTSNSSPAVQDYAKSRKCGYVYSREKDLQYDIVIVDSIQDRNLYKQAKKAFIPADAGAFQEDGCNFKLPINGGCGVIDYFVQHLNEYL